MKLIKSILGAVRNRVMAIFHFRSFQKRQSPESSPTTAPSLDPPLQCGAETTATNANAGGNIEVQSAGLSFNGENFTATLGNVPAPKGIVVFLKHCADLAAFEDNPN